MVAQLSVFMCKFPTAFQSQGLDSFIQLIVD